MSGKINVCFHSELLCSSPVALACELAFAYESICESHIMRIAKRIALMNYYREPH